ncbi:MAG: hypothetical protein ACRD3C_09820, partial [Vicinamibacterales bacterium]
MPKRQSSNPDINEAAFAAKQRVIALTEGDAANESPQGRATVLPMRQRKNLAAVALGRRGGLQRAKTG